MEETFRTIFEEWLAGELPKNVIERELKIKPSSIITAIIGPRRAGKTYLMFQTIKDLLSYYSKENILYVDFSDIRLRNISEKEFSTFLKVLHEIFREKEGKIILFLDEVQEIKEWDSWVRSLHNKRKYDIVISGSSSKLMAKEVSTYLRGRYVSKMLFPFSFSEFLSAKGIRAEYFNAPEIRGKILSMLREYIDFGGFPEVVLSENKRDLLKSYIDTIFYKDVVDRYKIRDIKSCEIFLKLLIESFGKKFSISKAYNYFKSLGISKSKKTIWNYLKYFNEAFFVIPLEKFSFSLRERLQYPIKLYSIDTGFYMREDFGLKMENLVSVALAREERECYYFQTKNGYEIDFLIKNGGRIEKLIQVTFANSFDEIDRREYIALIHAQELFKNDKPKCIIITWDYEDEKELKWFGKSAKIKFVPLWKWLLKI